MGKLGCAMVELDSIPSSEGRGLDYDMLRGVWGSSHLFLDLF